jgi:NTE family protein
LINGNKIQALFEEIFGDRTFADISAPLLIGAADCETGEAITISSGRIAHALRASVSVPVLMEPFYHPELGRWLMDGGIVENLPLPAALERYKGDCIIAVDVATALGSSFKIPQSGGSRRKLLKQAFIRTIRVMLKSQQARLPSDARVRFIRPDTSAFNAIDIRKLDQLYQVGFEAVSAVADWDSDDRV